MMLNNLSKVLASGLACLVAAGAGAHSFSVVAKTNSTSHGTGVVTNIGWGHALPMDDFISGEDLETYELHGPNGSKTALDFDRAANQRGSRTQEGAGVKIQAGDAFVNKMSFKDDAPKGTYTVAASMKQTNFSVYLDEKGKKHWASKTMDQITDAKKYTFSSNYQNFAKSFVTVGEWTEPKPVGHALEIIPLTDLSKVKAGDEVQFKITLNGKPVHTEGDGPHLRADGEYYGAGKSYSLQSRLNKDGIATIKVTEPGIWMVKVDSDNPVGPDNRPELVGKVLTSGYYATATFTVQAK